MSGLPGAVRPTVRCVREGLGYPKLPPATLPLDRLDTPVLRKAQEVCRTDPPSTGRIVSIDDRVLWKVKIERWRGAVWCELPRRWLVAAGRREAGSPDDFYADLADKGRRWRAEHNRAAVQPVTTDTLINRLLPAAEDEDRIGLEQAAAAVDQIRTVVAELVLSSAVRARPITEPALVERMRKEATYTTWINAVYMQFHRVESPLINPDDPGALLRWCAQLIDADAIEQASTGTSTRSSPTLAGRRLSLCSTSLRCSRENCRGLAEVEDREAGGWLAAAPSRIA